MDDNAFAIESGKFFEVIGKVSFRLVWPDSADSKMLLEDGQHPQMQNLAHDFVRTNMSVFYEWTNKNEGNFATPLGYAVSSWQYAGNWNIAP